MAPTKAETPSLALDHLAVACEDLEQGAQWLASKLGCLPDPGGLHPQMGTHNRLVRLGSDIYLEVIAIDPTAIAPPYPRWFGLDHFTGPPRLVGWVARAEPMRTLPDTTVKEMRRGDLCWQMTVPDTGDMPAQGAHPLLIHWQGGPHPCQRLPDRGFRLDEFHIQTPLAKPLEGIDPRIVINNGLTRLSAIISGNDGRIVRL